MKADLQADRKANTQNLHVRGGLQRTPVNKALVHDATPLVQEVLHSPGEPLDAQARAFFEPRFGHDFSQVRVHRDAKAVQSARAINARAYSAGRDIVFGENQYSPATAAGRRLLAHELTHVVQQATDAFRSLQFVRSDVLLLSNAYTSIYEREADAASKAVTRMDETTLPNVSITTINGSAVRWVDTFAPEYNVLSHSPILIARQSDSIETGNNIQERHFECNTASVDEIEQLFRAFCDGARMTRYKYYEAADNLEYFLSKSGGEHWLPHWFVLKDKFVQQARRSFMNRVVDQAWKMADMDLKSCQEKNLLLKNEIIHDMKPINPIYTPAVLYAIGRFDLVMKANITLLKEQDTNGNYIKFRVNAEDTFSIDDMFDWHENMKVNIPYIGDIDDRCGKRLEQEGRGKSFKTKISWTEWQSFIIDCKEGSISIDINQLDQAQPPLPQQ